MAAVIHMFCTLREAARRLQISEEQLETMVQRGILREFREGPHRLLKAADVVLLAQTLAGDRASSPAGAGKPPRAVGNRNVRLPHCAAATAGIPCGNLARPRTTGQPSRTGTPGAARATQTYATRYAQQRMEGSPAPSGRPSGSSPELSVREWFWNGLAQDRPMAIILLFGLALLVLVGVVAGVVLAAKVL